MYVDMGLRDFRLASMMSDKIKETHSWTYAMQSSNDGEKKERG